MDVEEPEKIRYHIARARTASGWHWRTSPSWALPKHSLPGSAAQRLQPRRAKSLDIQLYIYKTSENTVRPINMDFEEPEKIRYHIARARTALGWPGPWRTSPSRALPKHWHSLPPSGFSGKFSQDERNH